MDIKQIHYNHGYRNVYFPNSTEHLKCRVIKTVSKGGVWEKKISHKIFTDCKDGQLAIDIGANIGIHTVSMLDGVKGGSVIAFEPQEDLSKCLIKTLSGISNNYLISTNLVSNKNENKLFYSDGSGRSRIPIEGDRYVKNWNKTYIQSTTLDDFLLKNNQELPLCLIKIDVEGHEFEVLEGAKNTINKYEPIIYIEVWNKKGDLNKLVEWCTTNGYNMDKLTPNDYRLFKDK
tara:strand:- start:1 stop:696 length:696 start_codon:yes stop_codon:yes gene_type:complete